MKKNIIKFLKKYKIQLGFILLVFVGISLGIWNLNKAGQVWDETGVLRLGYKHFELAKNLNFTDPFWWSGGTEDHPPLVRYIRGVAGIWDIKEIGPDGVPIFNYDLTHDRLVSVLLFTLTIILVYLFGIRYVSYFVGISAGLILAMLPVPLGHSQIGMYEPFNLFFFTASTLSFIYFLESPNKKRIFIAGLSLGLAFLSKETNLMLIPMLLGIIVIKKFTNKEKIPKDIFLKTFEVFIISGIVFFVLWPMPFFHIKEFIDFQMTLRANPKLSIPEVFFGKLMLNRFYYYFFEFIITTPLITLILGLIGLLKIDKSKKWIWYSLVLWFVFPFILSFYWQREQGIRYIIQICAPFSLIAAMGLWKLSELFGKSIKAKIILLIFLLTYQIVTLYRITPYYYNYFNSLVGGAKGVYEKRYFHLGWWGEGLREAGFYIRDHAKKGSSIGLATTPTHTFPPIGNFFVEPYNANKTYDYVVVNFYNIIRIGFDDTQIRKKYKHVYSVMADGAEIVKVYQLK